MDAQLKEIIDTIKSEGVQSAEKQSAEIIQKAEDQAAEITGAAEKRAAEIVENAKREAARHEQSGREALKQAGRDLLLNLESRITKLFDSVVATSTREAMTSSVMEEAIVTLISSWAGNEAGELEVLLPQERLSQIEAGLRKKLSDQLQAGLTLKPFNDLDAGFRIAEKDGAAYYDFSADGVAAVLTRYLNPRLSDILQEAAGEQG